jgi:parallel beta-helix repeat protein
MITGNNASLNSVGIYLYGSGNNHIYNNYFKNTKNAFDNSNNIWNRTKTPGTDIVGGPWLGGNYWGDYNGTDEDGDGLGDTLLPYNCSENIIHGGDYLPLIKPKPPIGKTIWETNISIDMAPNETKNIITVVPLDMLNDMTGKVELITTLYSDLGQIIAYEDPFFYITDTNTSLILETDKIVYKPKETIAIYGEVKNHGSRPEGYNLSIKKDGIEIFADAFTLNPNKTHDFALNTSSNTSFTLEGTVDGVEVTDFVNVETASINVSVITPDVVGISPFNVAVLIENTGNISADLNVKINRTWDITIPEGESRLLEETTMSITKNTTLNVTISGDVHQTYQKGIICGENARINITPEQTYLEGTVDIPYIIENFGLLDSEFNATFSIDAQTVTENFFVPKGENITGCVAFNLTIGAHLLRYVSPFEEVNVTINVLSPPEFVVTSIYPGDMDFTLGENVILMFEVENIGGTEGEATLRLEMPDFEDTNRTWVRPGTEENISFNLTIPDDLEEKNYKGIYELDGKRDEFRFFVQGAKISVEASLDKPLYEEGETAILTLNVDNERNMDLSLYSRVKFNEYDSVQNFTLPGLGSKTLTFNVPVNFTGDNKMLYTVYMDSGRSLYINSIYIYEELPDVPLRLFTDKDVYNMGDVVTVHIIDVTKIDVLNLTAPGCTYNDTISGPTMLEFTLPERRSGTYYIEYTFGNFSAAYPFDVVGYSARILEASLDKEEYRDGDTVKLKMNIETNRNVPGLLRTGIYDPENELVDEIAMNKTLMEGENEIEISRILLTNKTGIHVIVYGFYAELSGHSLTMLVSGAEYFDASSLDTKPPLITNVRTTKITADSVVIKWDTDEVSDSLVKYGTEPWTYTMQKYDSSRVASHSVSLIGLSAETTYSYVVNSTDSSGNSNESFKYNFTTKGIEIAPPNITSFAPQSPVNDTVCNLRIFNITVTQTVNVGWYLNDSLLFTNESVTEANCTLHAELAGEHNVSAIAVNPNGTDIQTWIWNVTAPNQPPIASGIYTPVHPVVNQIIAFNASNSTDPDGTITNYEWDFGDGTKGIGVTVNHSYSRAGSYTVILAVTDNDGAKNSCTAYIVITPTPLPIPPLPIPPLPIPPMPPLYPPFS